MTCPRAGPGVHHLSMGDGAIRRPRSSIAPARRAHRPPLDRKAPDIGISSTARGSLDNGLTVTALQDGVQRA